MSSRTLGLAAGYRSRAVDAIRGGYPRLAVALGDALFDSVVAAYLARYPAPSVSIYGCGEHLPAMLAEGPYPMWYGELAALDRAHVEVLESAGAAAMQAAHLAGVERIRLVPAHALVELMTNADEIWRAIADRELPPRPRDLDWPRTVLIWRHGKTLRQRRAELDEVTPLRAAARGATLEMLSAGNMARTLDIVLRWIHDGLVTTS